MKNTHLSVMLRVKKENLISIFEITVWIKTDQSKADQVLVADKSKGVH